MDLAQKPWAVRNGMLSFKSISLLARGCHSQIQLSFRRLDHKFTAVYGFKYSKENLTSDII